VSSSLELKTRESLLSINQLDTQWFTFEEEINRLFPTRCIQRLMFIVPPDADKSLFNYATAKRGRYWNFPAYGPGLMATHLREDGLTVDIVNLNHEILKACAHSENEASFDFDCSWQTVLEQRLNEFKPDMVGVTCMFSQTNGSASLLCEHIHNVAPEVPIALGGVHITNSFVNDASFQQLLENFSSVNFLFLYEAELALKQFVRVVNRTTEDKHLQQLYVKGQSDSVYFSGRHAVKGSDLDTIPAHDLMDTDELSLYGKVGSFYCLKPEDAKFTTVLSNRGCRARCTFCSVRNFNGMGVRTRSIGSIIDELKLLKEDYDIDHIMWLDDDLFRNEKRATALFNAMADSELGITWDCTNGVIAASCTESLIASAARSGCLGLTIGMKSGNDKMLREIRKPGSVDVFLKAAKVLRQHEEINARVFLMIGFPNETYRQILDTFHVAREMDLDWYNITTLQPLPNTPMFDSMLEQGLISPVSFNEIRYNSGSYGKQREKAEINKDLLSGEFKDAFNNIDLDEVPLREELDDIWAYMNYHLNFRRLFSEKRPKKLIQQLAYVQNITDVVAPESAFAMYFCGYLQFKVHGRIEPKTVTRLRECLESSDYWRSRFNEFDLSVDHLESLDFPHAAKANGVRDV